MSMTQVALLKKAEIPSKEKIQTHICELGYDFKFTEELKNKLVIGETSGYASWNTAGNTIGTALPHGVLFELSRNIFGGKPNGRFGHEKTSVSQGYTEVFDSRGNKTAIELFLQEIRGWDVGVRRQVDDGKSELD